MSADQITEKVIKHAPEIMAKGGSAGWVGGSAWIWLAENPHVVANICAFGGLLLTAVGVFWGIWIKERRFRLEREMILKNNRGLGDEN